MYQYSRTLAPIYNAVLETGIIDSLDSYNYRTKKRKFGTRKWATVLGEEVNGGAVLGESKLFIMVLAVGSLKPSSLAMYAVFLHTSLQPGPMNPFTLGRDDGHIHVTYASHTRHIRG